MDIISYALAKKAKASADTANQRIDDLGSVFSYRGTVEHLSDLPTTGNRVGDVYGVDETGGEYVWTEVTDNTYEWQELGIARDYREFPTTWNTQGTTLQFMQAVNADSSATAGKLYLGDVTFSDMPFNGNAELIVSILSGTVSDKVILATLTSGTNAPYH